MNNEDLKKQIAAIVEKQIKIATYCMDESLFPDSFQTEIQNCFNVIIEKTNALIDDFEPELEFEFEDIKDWFKDHAIDLDETDDLLDYLEKDNIKSWVEDNIETESSDIIIRSDSIVQRDRIKNFLETEIFTDCLRYNAAVDNL